jgi:AraC-like DNA-binding protein
MNFNRIKPRQGLENIIECFWMVDGDEARPDRQKIIPDAFTELIFHFGDPYRIRLSTRWETQGRSLFAGQINKHFYLENTGRSGIFAIKLRPSAATHLFGTQMSELTNKVIDLQTLGKDHDLLVLDKAVRYAKPAERQSTCERFFFDRIDRVPRNHPVDNAVNEIFKQHGMVAIKELAEVLAIGERYIEQIFKKYIGLSPKLFSRIVRFNYIFQLIQDKDPNWSDVVFQSGFYDQSHFIRNFKAFTGEDPSKYTFGRKDLANFFLKQK